MPNQFIFMQKELHAALTTYVFNAIDDDVIWIQKTLNYPESIPRAHLVAVYKIWFDTMGKDAQGLVDLSDAQLRKHHPFVASGYFALKIWFTLHPEQQSGILDDDYDDLRNLKDDMDARWGVEHPGPETVKNILETALRSAWNKGYISTDKVQKLANNIKEEGERQTTLYKSEYTWNLVRQGAIVAILVGGAVYIAWRIYKSHQKP